MKLGWRYELLEEYSFIIPEFAGLISETFMHEWFTLDMAGTFTIKSGYAWDGSTGMPDGEPIERIIPGFFVKCLRENDRVRTTTRASLGHDALYQFMEVIAEILKKALRWVRKIADRLFAKYLKIDGFSPMWLYYLGVRVFGGIYHWVRKILKKKEKENGRDSKA